MPLDKKGSQYFINHGSTKQNQNTNIGFML
jgi:hypothetical protein